jgi:hypothetical protein
VLLLLLLLLRQLQLQGLLLHPLLHLLGELVLSYLLLLLLEVQWGLQQPLHLLLLLLLLLAARLLLLLLLQVHLAQLALLPTHPLMHPSDHLLLQSLSDDSTRACSLECTTR